MAYRNSVDLYLGSLNPYTVGRQWDMVKISPRKIKILVFAPPIIFNHSLFYFLKGLIFYKSLHRVLLTL
jgi:hypothetical protein